MARQGNATDQLAHVKMREEKTKGEEKANRDTAEFKNRRNRLLQNDIAKANGDKNAFCASLYFRLIVHLDRRCR